MHRRVALLSTVSGLGYGVLADVLCRWPSTISSTALFVFAVAGFGAGEVMLGFDLFEDTPALFSSVVIAFGITGLCAGIMCVARGPVATVPILWLWFAVSGIALWPLWPIVVINLVVIGRIGRSRPPETKSC